MLVLTEEGRGGADVVGDSSGGHNKSIDASDVAPLARDVD
jgi:hypothetical protein